MLTRTDILAKTIIIEKAVVRKAGGKFKMNPLFPSTVAKIKEVSPYLATMAFLKKEKRRDC